MKEYLMFYKLVSIRLPIPSTLSYFCFSMFGQLPLFQWKTFWLNRIYRSCCLIASITPCILLSTGCTPVELPAALIHNKPLKEIALDWQVDKLTEPGTYEIAGKTNLPDRTQLTVAALRYLYPVAAAARKLNDNPTYTILDYQSVTVEQGAWQTQLNLWQVDADKTFKENWQIDQQGLAMRFNPGDEVVFLVTLTPIDQLLDLKQPLSTKGQTFQSSRIRTTPEGELYAQSQQTLTIELPTGKSTSASPQLQAENFGWGRRYLIPQEPQNPTQLEQPNDRQTDSPARPEEFLR